MNFDDIEVGECLVQSRMPVGGYPTTRLTQGMISTDAGDDATEPCGNADPVLTGLTIYPNSNLGTDPNCANGGFVEGDGEFQFRAYATYSNGTVVEVTTDATWTTSAPTDIPIGENTGVVTCEIAAPTGGGYLTERARVYANYEGWAAESCVTARSECDAIALDIVLVLDGSGSMLQASPNTGVTLIEQVRNAARALAQQMRSSRDRIALVRFGGIWDSIYPTGRTGDATEFVQLQLPLTTSQTTVLAAVEEIDIIRPQYTPEPPFTAGQAYRFWGATGIGSGLAKAVEIFGSCEIVRDDAQRIIILITDGQENMEQPAPEDVAAPAKASGITIVTIGVNVPAAGQARIDALATEGRSYQYSNGDNLSGLLAGLPAWLCCENDTYYPCNEYY